MTFAVQFANGVTESFPDDARYAFLAGGVLYVCTADEHNYFAPGQWLTVSHASQPRQLPATQSFRASQC
ncbi:Uncharacterised protein [Mycobacteroides abscessus subsp. abscessus]|nr:Uncharacterised protein [Mycobacteroides abscessus subsp. abscessus]